MTTQTSKIQEDIYETLLNEGYTEEQIMSILGLQGLHKKYDALGEQIEYENEASQEEFAEGIQGKRVFNAQSPVTQIMTALRKKKAKDNMGELFTEKEGISDEITQATLDYLRAQNRPGGGVPRASAGGAGGFAGNYQGGLV